MEAARVLRGLTQADLGEAVGVSQRTISQIEIRASRAEPGLTRTIATALGFPVDLFEQPDPSPRIGHVLRASLPRTARNDFLASVTMANAHANLLLGPHAANILRDPDGYAHPHDFAARLRRRWALPTGPVTRLIPTLEAQGIVCIYRDLTPIRTPALISTTERGQTLLFLDAGATRVELAWGIAHELGHRVFGEEPLKKGENDADAFAAAFLMPGRELLDDDELRVGLDLALAATAWGVRPRALAQRLRELNRITDLQFRALVHDAKALPEVDGRTSLIGVPAALADAVRCMGGSHAAARQAHLTTEELRRDYLARSGR